MLSLLRCRVRDMEKRTALELVQADFRHWPVAGQPFDGIVTRFFLDLFKPDTQRSIIQKIATLSCRETIWVNVDFQARLGSPLYRCIDWLHYRFDGLVSGTDTDRHYDPVQWISAAGWISRQERTFRKGSVVAELFVRTEPSFDGVAAEQRRINLPQNQQEMSATISLLQDSIMTRKTSMHRPIASRNIAARSKREATRRNRSLADFGSARR